MGLRALLLPVTGHHADDVALRIAFEIAQTFESHLSALCLRPDPVDIARYVADWTAPVMTGELVAAVESEAASAAQDAGRAFEEWRVRHGLPAGPDQAHAHGVSVSWTERIGASAVILRDAARFADLVVMRGLGPSGPVDGDAMLEAVLFDAGRPILLSPAIAPSSLFEGALVAWAGGREEVRAIAAALPLLGRMKRVEIRTIGSAESAHTEELIAYLGHHGVVAKAAHMEPAGRSVSETLLSEARGMGASLLVMGGYHHSRTREAVFGGTTRQIISHVELPVLLAH
ncbi:MAG: UspA [Rhodospirillales bacterium]|nr:UspA [Rhodospirillales bacterium]